MVAGSKNNRIGKLDLKAAHAGQRSCGGADLGRIFRQSREIIAHDSGGVRELVSRKLHPVAGISGESHGDRRSDAFCFFSGHRIIFFPYPPSAVGMI